MIIGIIIAVILIPVAFALGFVIALKMAGYTRKESKDTANIMVEYAKVCQENLEMRNGINQMNYSIHKKARQDALDKGTEIKKEIQEQQNKVMGEFKDVLKDYFEEPEPVDETEKVDFRETMEGE